MLRRDAGRGWAASWHAHLTLPRIFQWRCPDYGTAPTDVIVHTLVGEEQAALAAWMLASFHHATRRNWLMVIHDDGTLTEKTADRIGAMFQPDKVSVLTRADADAAMADALAQHLHCQQYRARHPLALKILDIPILTPADKFLLLDSDVLFFRKPNALLAWADSDSLDCWFNQDVAEASLISPAETRQTLRLTLWERLNSGLCCISRQAIDLDFCDHCLRKTNIARSHIWRIEQTLFALCASKYNRGGLLPPCYEVSLGHRASPDCVARHYVGAVRDRFYGEGLSRLANLLKNKAQ